MSSSGLLTANSGTLVEGNTWTIKSRVRDVNGNGLSATCDITFTVGIQHVPQAICYGLIGSAKAVCNQSWETFFGASNATTSTGAYGTIAGVPASFTECVRPPCVATNSPSDDGSNGNFYCINGGTIGGIARSCTCTSCNTGFGGPNCAICATGYSGSPPDDCSPDPCQATSTSTDDGSDGNFYCINGGDIGGTTGSCTCSSCNTGFDGINCQNPHHVSDMNVLFNTVSNADNEYTSNTCLLYTSPSPRD